jgi:hypothetical protein
MPIQPEIQGQPFRPSASRERQITQVLQKSRQASSGAQGYEVIQQEYSFTYAQIPSSASVATIKPFEAVYLDGAAPVAPSSSTFVHLAQRIVNCFHRSETSTTFRQWGIALDTITKDNPGRVLLSGVSWLDTASVSPLESDATHFNLIDNSLVCGYNGRAAILHTPTQPHCLVELSDRRSVLMGKTKTGGLEKDVEGEVFYVTQNPSGWSETAIEIKAWPAKEKIQEDRFVLLLPTEGKYIAIDATIPQFVRFTLTALMRDESTATATINSEGDDNGNEITVERWAEEMEGEAGDRGIAWWDGETYWVIVLNDSKRHKLIRFTLTANLQDESTATATINSTRPDDGDAITVTRWADNSFGESGDQGIAWWDGETYWVIELSPSTQLKRFTLTSRLVDESTATATINSAGDDNGDAITVTRWSYDTEGEISDRGIAWVDGDTYWILELGSATKGVIFQATSTPAFGSFNGVQSFTATILNSHNPSLVGQTITVKTIGRTRIKSGMRGAAIPFGIDWIAYELQQPAAELIGTLSANLLPSSATAASVTVDSATRQFPDDVLPVDATITAQNVFRLHGFDDAKVLLRYDAANDNYFIAQVYGYADRIVGSVSSDFESSDATVSVGSVSGLNGLLSPAISGGTVTVHNTHEWNGSSGGRARAEYNWTAERWELYQIDCSEEQGSPPGTEEEEPGGPL